MVLVEVSGCCRQIRTRQRGDHDPTLHHQRECDCILPAAEETFRAIDRIERPESLMVVTAAAMVDPVADRLAVDLGLSGRFGADGADMPEHLFEDNSVLRA